MKTITLGDWLKMFGVPIQIAKGGDCGTLTKAPYEAWTLGYRADGDTPEDALQGLVEVVCGPDTVLMIPASARSMDAMRTETQEMLENEPTRAECLQASLESLLKGFLAFNTGSHEEDTMRTHLLKVLVETAIYLLEQHDAKDRT